MKTRSRQQLGAPRINRENEQKDGIQVQKDPRKTFERQGSWGLWGKRVTKIVDAHMLHAGGCTVVSCSLADNAIPMPATQISCDRLPAYHGMIADCTIQKMEVGKFHAKEELESYCISTQAPFPLKGIKSPPSFDSTMALVSEVRYSSVNVTPNITSKGQKHRRLWKRIVLNLLQLTQFFLQSR